MFNSRKQTMIEEPAVGKVKMCSRVEQCVMWASHLFHQTKHNSGLQIFFPKEFLSVFINKRILFTIIPPNIEAF